METRALTTYELGRLGLGQQRITSMLSDGELVRPFRGVYLTAELAHDLVGVGRALARLIPPGAALARSTAAWLHGLDVRSPASQDAPPPLEVVVPAGWTPPRHPAVRAYAARLPASDVTHVDGVPVTSIERTALDLARYAPPFMALAALDALVRSGRVSPERLAVRLESWAGERNVAIARRLIGACDGRAESFGESWLRLRVLDAGFPPPEPQIWIPVTGRGLYRLDLGWRELRIGVEYDGMEFHSSPDDVARDIERRESLARRFGWHVIGVDRGAVLGRGMELERGIGELLGMTPSISRRSW